MTNREIPRACIGDARVQAFVPPVVQHPVGYRGGPVLTRPEHRVFRHHRGNAVIDNFTQDGSFDTRLLGDFTYGGALYDHFGHFMAEMVHRILPSRRAGLPDRYLFVTSSGNEAHGSFEALPAHIRDILSFLDLTAENVVIVRENVTVERLHIVEQAAQHHGDPKDWYLRELSAFATAKLDRLFGATQRPARIYVSRSGMTMAGAILGEPFLERRLERAGFTVFHPERHSFAAQMDHYRKAECVVFTQGSACHGTELLGAGALANTILIPKSVKSDFFRRVLQPRSRNFQVAGAPRMAGTMHYHPETRFQFIHLGASVVDLRALARCLRNAGIDGFSASRAAYAKAAAGDLLRYLRQSGKARADKRQAAGVVLGFAREILRP